MSEYINKYTTPAGYAAGASSRPTDASSVSAVGAAVEFDGINVVVPVASRRVGDHIFLDKSVGKLVAFRGGTLRPSLLDADRFVNLRNIFFGRAFGKNLFVQYDQMVAERYAAPDEWTVSGFSFASAGSATLLFKYYSAAVADGQKELTLAWQAGATIEELISTVNNTTGLKTYCSAVKINGTTMGVYVNGYSTAMGITVQSGDVVATRTYQGYQARHYTEDPRAVYGVTNILRHGGAVSTSGFACYDKFFDYYSVSGVDTEEALGGGTVKKSAFNETTNPGLYAQFGGDYDAYMTAQFDLLRAEYPCNREAMARIPFGGDCSDALAAVTHVNFLGETVHDFPNAYRASLAGVSVEGFETGFEPGTGHLGGVAEALLLYRQIRRGADDVINVSLKEGSGTVVNYGTTTRLAFQSNANAAWIFNGNIGNVNYSSARVSACAARVFRAFSDQDLEL